MTTREIIQELEKSCLQIEHSIAEEEVKATTSRKGKKHWKQIRKCLRPFVQRLRLSGKKI